jgi:hypothetical protein
LFLKIKKKLKKVFFSRIKPIAPCNINFLFNYLRININ